MLARLSLSLVFCLLALAGPARTASATEPSLADAQTLVASERWDDAIAMLRVLTERDASDARAWGLLGRALHGKGELEPALAAYEEATASPMTAPTALYNGALVLGRLGRLDEAYAWIERARATGRIDLTQIDLDPEAAALRTDSRWSTIFPSAEEFAAPFVESARVLHEWHGVAANDQFGWIARDAGDVDGDGVHDLTTSAPTHDGAGEDSGRIYTYSGRTGALLWTADGPAGGTLGLGIEAAGDVDGDGRGDVIAGAPTAGLAQVYRGSDGQVLLTLRSPETGDAFGRRVSDLGDVDGDGRDDLLVGAPDHDRSRGRVDLLSGRDGTVLRSWTGEREGDRFGSAVAGGAARAGVWLTVVGAPDAGAGNEGRVYVFEGLDAAARLVIENDEGGAQLGGMFVSVVGDVDADGTADVYASDWAHGGNGPFSGRVFVHSGASGERLLTLAGERAGDGFGIGPADAGDVDGDGHDDLVIGAWRHAGAAPMGGKVYLFSGADGSVLRTLTGRVMGETLGFDATGLGDVDGDGVIDLLLTSAWSAIAGARSGRVYVVSSRW